MNGDEVMKIDWDKFGSKFVKFKDGEKKKLVCTSWRQKEKVFGVDPAKVVLKLDVLVEDDARLSLPKVLEVTSFEFVNKLRPLIEQAESSGSPTISFCVTRWGVGPQTKYSVEPVL